MSDLFEVKWTETRGYGVFAKRPIPSYTVIVQESPILAIPHTPANPAQTDANIEAAFNKLSRGHQTSVLQLHEGSHPAARTKVTRIFHANSFGGEDGEKLYLVASRFNHSCVPNARHWLENGGAACIRSDKTIAAGEEIAISYLPPFQEAMTTRQRATTLQLHYAFKCRCVACWPPKESWKSDARRQLIGLISYALEGRSPPDFVPHMNRPSPPIPSGRVLTEAQKVEYNFLLAKLREAEGSPGNLIAECYLRAATKLGYQQPKYGKHEATKDITFLEAARCIEAWYKKGLELEEKYYGPDHDQVREGKVAWSRVWSQIQCLQALRLSSLVKLKDPSSYIPSKSGEDFAVLMNDKKFTMTLLSRDETAALIKHRQQMQ